MPNIKTYEKRKKVEDAEVWGGGRKRERRGGGRGNLNCVVNVVTNELPKQCEEKAKDKRQKHAHSWRVKDITVQATKNMET